MEHPEQQLLIEKATDVRHTGEAPFLYVNSAQVRVTPYDFQFVFGQSAEMDAANALVVNKLITLVMSPQHAKALLGVLQRHVQAFEQLMGSIQVGPTDDAMRQMRDATEQQQPSSRSRGAARKKA